MMEAAEQEQHDVSAMDENQQEQMETEQSEASCFECLSFCVEVDDTTNQVGSMFCSCV